MERASQLARGQGVGTMKSSIEATQPGEASTAQPAGAAKEEFNGAWLVFIRYCRQLGFGEIERLKIQDGVPILAEVTTKKIKFEL